MEKKDWKTDVYWSLSSPLAVKVPSWKRYPLDLYLSEYIVTLRMRDYMFGEHYNLHSVMADNKEVIMTA